MSERAGKLEGAYCKVEVLEGRETEGRTGTQKRLFLVLQSADVEVKSQHKACWWKSTHQSFPLCCAVFLPGIMTLSAKQTLSYLDKAQHKVWDFLITYETERITLVKDIKLGVVHKSLLIGVAIYLIYTIITSHAYMVKESPATTVNSWVSEQDFLVKQENVRNGVDGEPDYCDNPSTNYVFDDQFTYLDNKCDFEAIVAEVFDEESTAVSFVTYYQDERLKKVGIGEDANKFIPFVEDLDLFFSHGFTTSLGVSGANVETVLKSRDGGNEKKFEKGQAVTLKVGDLVRMAGVDLNARHVNSGGLDPSKDARSEGWPLFRMTGVDLIVGRYKAGLNSKRLPS